MMLCDQICMWLLLSFYNIKFLLIIFKHSNFPLHVTWHNNFQNQIFLIYEPRILDSDSIKMRNYFCKQTFFAGENLKNWWIFGFPLKVFYLSLINSIDHPLHDLLKEIYKLHRNKQFNECCAKYLLIQIKVNLSAFLPYVLVFNQE